MAKTSLCAKIAASPRALLASLWSVVTILTMLAFLTGLTFTLSTRRSNQDDYYNYNNNNGDQNAERDATIAVTSRAIAFASLWVAVLATLMIVFGTVILGWQSPTGQYYTCCSSNVHRTTPMSLGSFIGALLMFSNLTLVCSILFGEFEILDYQREGEGERDVQVNDTAMGRSSNAFSVMCIFLTIMYGSFAGLTFSFSQSVIEEDEADRREESLARQTTVTPHNFNSYGGYIGERFDVHPRAGGGPPGFVAPQPPNVTGLT